ncbi:MAG: Eco57I restriction-modification methylase domain-containing protein, partial [Bacilli bacterium]|nr:Eco57I restriction-modification methylase domain-containing protein [Bacilli bacterium]
LIYGADIPYDEEITLERFIDKVDDASWSEFMPTDVTKEVFGKFKKYYDEDIFIGAGRRIRNIAREADILEPTERVKKVASLFSNFKNPDKETVLTPWRVVNMHMSDCLGGYDFWDEKHKKELNEPRFVDRGKVTEETFSNTSSQILEINSKTGLYPLYVTYIIYRAKCKNYKDDELTLEVERQLWNETIQNNVFVICKTPMAKQITQRTLAGYSNIKINAHYFDDLINQMEHKSKDFVDKVLKPSYWKKGDIGQMKFDAVVGNPPYQLNDGAGGGSAKPIYQYFVESSKKLEPNYISFIMPARWYVGGKGLDDFRDSMLHDKHIEKIVDFSSSNDCFKGVEIKGGICYFLRGNQNHEICEIININKNSRSEMRRALLEDGMST